MSMPSGLTIPTTKYSHSIAQEFPRASREYHVESTIASRLWRDYLPNNTNINSSAGFNNSDTYFDFNLTGNSNEFFDTNSFALETKIKFFKADGSDLDNDCHIVAIDGLAHRMISRCSVFLNGVQIQNNPYFGICNVVQAYLSMNKDALPSAGRTMLFKPLETRIDDKLAASQFTDVSASEKNIVRKTMHLITPLNLDIASADFWMLSNVDIRIRLDLAPASILINAYDDNQYTYEIQFVRLFCQKIVPHPSALVSLNRSLENNRSVIEYIHSKMVVKSFILQNSQTVLSLDNMFTSVVPIRIHIIFMRQSALNGDFKINSAHFHNVNMTGVRLDIDGNSIANFKTSFPNEATNLFYHTLMNAKDESNLLTYDSFIAGRTILTFDLQATECSDTLPIEKNGNIRMHIETKNNAENMVCLVVAETSGLIEINSNRQIKTSYLL